MAFWKVVKLEMNECASMLIEKNPKTYSRWEVAVNDPCTVFHKMIHVRLRFMLKQIFFGVPVQSIKSVKGKINLSSCQLYTR